MYEAELYGGLPPHNNTDTSLAAAKSVQHTAVNVRERVFNALKANKSTCYEIEETLGIRAQTATARIRELVLLDRVEATDERRPTWSGRAAIVWQSKEN
jgi:predicted HTH transcriptional regulator